MMSYTAPEIKKIWQQEDAAHPLFFARTGDFDPVQEGFISVVIRELTSTYNECVDIAQGSLFWESAKTLVAAGTVFMGVSTLSKLVGASAETVENINVMSGLALGAFAIYNIVDKEQQQRRARQLCDILNPNPSQLIRLLADLLSYRFQRALPLLCPVGGIDRLAKFLCLAITSRVLDNTFAAEHPKTYRLENKGMRGAISDGASWLSTLVWGDSSAPQPIVPDQQAVFLKVLSLIHLITPEETDPLWSRTSLTKGYLQTIDAKTHQKWTLQGLLLRSGAVTLTEAGEVQYWKHLGVYVRGCFKRDLKRDRWQKYPWQVLTAGAQISKGLYSSMPIPEVGWRVNPAGIWKPVLFREALPEKIQEEKITPQVHMVRENRAATTEDERALAAELDRDAAATAVAPAPVPAPVPVPAQIVERAVAVELPVVPPTVPAQAVPVVGKKKKAKPAAQTAAPLPPAVVQVVAPPAPPPTAPAKTTIVAKEKKPAKPTVKALETSTPLAQTAGATCAQVHIVRESRASTSEEEKALAAAL